MLLMASSLTFRQDVKKLGLDPRQMATRVTKMQEDVIRDMVTNHGKGVFRAILNPRAGMGPKILDFIHPPHGLESVSASHQRVHAGLTRALTAIDHAFA